MKRIPIYQMTYGQDKDGNSGLVFTSEQERNYSQSILFAIPIPIPFKHPLDFIEFLNHQTIYFPFLLGEKYFDLEAKVNFRDLLFTIPEKNIQITFELDYDHFDDWGFFSFGRRKVKQTKYVGNQNNLILSNIGFLILLPVDLYEMDELYNKYKGVFVGLTPNFGRFSDDNT